MTRPTSPTSVTFIQDEPRTLFILDWDDTLAPTTAAAIAGFTHEDAELNWTQDVQQKWGAYAYQLASFLRTCCQLGKVVIVTNAMQGWVERSCRRLMPSVAPMLATIQIISARSRYQSQYPGDPVQWKVKVYKSLLKTHTRWCTNGKHQVIAIGDSWTDREAIQLTSSGFNALQLKSIKLLSDPTMDQLQKEVKMLDGYLAQLVDRDEPLDLVLSDKMLR